MKLILLSLLFCALPLSAAELTGTVIYVYDGDTVTLRTEDGSKHKIRLYGIDSPETKQAYGQAAKLALWRMVFKQVVTVEYTKKDRYGRIIGKIKKDGENINAEMVLRGSAWHYVRYAPKDLLLKQSESMAKSEDMGLWQDTQPMPPWNYRKQVKNEVGK